jgi:hypothetical protein
MFAEKDYIKNEEPRVVVWLRSPHTIQIPITTTIC